MIGDASSTRNQGQLVSVCVITSNQDPRMDWAHRKLPNLSSYDYGYSLIAQDVAGGVTGTNK